MKKHRQVSKKVDSKPDIYRLDFAFNRELDEDILKIMKRRYRFDKHHREGVKHHYLFNYEVTGTKADKKGVSENPTRTLKESFITMLEDCGFSYNGNWNMTASKI